MAEAKKRSPKLKVGERVTVQGYACEGTVKFSGKSVHESDAKGKLRVGVALDQPIGKNNGTVGGHAYFECPQGHGVFVPKSKVTKVPAVAEELVKPESKINPLFVEDDAPEAPKPKTEDDTASEKTAGSAVIKVGSRVNVVGYECQGVVEFDGEVHKKRRIGIALDKPEGKNDGSISGVQYFTCADKHGIFTIAKKVTLVPENEKEAKVKAEEAPPPKVEPVQEQEPEPEPVKEPTPEPPKQKLKEEEAERVAKEKSDKEAAVKAEVERVEAERVEAERVEAERVEAERVAKERSDKEAADKAEAILNREPKEELKEEVIVKGSRFKKGSFKKANAPESTNENDESNPSDMSFGAFGFKEKENKQKEVEQKEEQKAPVVVKEIKKPPPKPFVVKNTKTSWVPEKPTPTEGAKPPPNLYSMIYTGGPATRSKNIEPEIEPIEMEDGTEEFSGFGDDAETPAILSHLSATENRRRSLDMGGKPSVVGLWKQNLEKPDDFEKPKPVVYNTGGDDEEEEEEEDDEEEEETEEETVAAKKAFRYLMRITKDQDQ